MEAHLREVFVARARDVVGNNDLARGTFNRAGGRRSQRGQLAVSDFASQPSTLSALRFTISINFNASRSRDRQPACSCAGLRAGRQRFESLFRAGCALGSRRPHERRKALPCLNQSQFGPSPQEPLCLIGQLADDLGRWLGSLDSAYGLAGPQSRCLDGTGRISIRHSGAKARYR